MGSELANWSSSGGKGAGVKIGVPTSPILRVDPKGSVLDPPFRGMPHPVALRAPPRLNGKLLAVHRKEILPKELAQRG